MMQYLVLGRIGPMEEGERKDTYLEAGEFAPAEFFKPESIALLEAAGVLRAATAEEIAAEERRSTEQGVELSNAASASNGPEETAPRKRAGKKFVTEAEHGTDDSNGD